MHRWRRRGRHSRLDLRSRAERKRERGSERTSRHGKRESGKREGSEERKREEGERPRREASGVLRFQRSPSRSRFRTKQASKSLVPQRELGQRKSHPEASSGTRSIPRPARCARVSSRASLELGYSIRPNTRICVGRRGTPPASSVQKPSRRIYRTGVSCLTGLLMPGPSRWHVDWKGSRFEPEREGRRVGVA